MIAIGVLLYFRIRKYSKLWPSVSTGRRSANILWAGDRSARHDPDQSMRYGFLLAQIWHVAVETVQREGRQGRVDGRVRMRMHELPLSDLVVVLHWGLRLQVPVRRIQGNGFVSSVRSGKRDLRPLISVLNLLLENLLVAVLAQGAICVDLPQIVVGYWLLVRIARCWLQFEVYFTFIGAKRLKNSLSLSSASA